MCVIALFAGGGVKDSNETRGLKPKIKNHIKKLCKFARGVKNKKRKKRALKDLGVLCFEEVFDLLTGAISHWT